MKAYPANGLAGLARQVEKERGDWTWLAVAVVLGGGMMFAGAAIVTGLRSQRDTREAAVAPAAAMTSRSSVPMATALRPTKPRLPPGVKAVQWEDLTLMLRAGLRDEEILTETAGLPLIQRIGPWEEGFLRGLGGGSRLVNALRARPVYAVPEETTAGRVVVTAPPMYQDAAPVYQSAPPVYQPSALVAAPPPLVYSAPSVDYAARDRQVADLKRQMEDLDERIRLIRSNPQRYYTWYASYGIDRQQAMDRYLDKLDKDRNDLRREKWALEGR